MKRNLADRTAPDVIEARSQLVAGAPLAGDQHPHPKRKGWYFTGTYAPDGTLLWYRPMATWQKVVWGLSLGALTLLFGGIAVAMAIGREWVGATFVSLIVLGIWWKAGPKPPVLVTPPDYSQSPPPPEDERPGYRPPLPDSRLPPLDRPQ